MHVNPEQIRHNSGAYNANSTAQAKAKAGADMAGKAAEKSEKPAVNAAKKDEFSFWDIVDIVNPLQHIPVVNTIYREITGDQINNFGRIAGGAIFGGFAGAALGGMNAIAKNETGNDLGEMAMVKAGFRPDVPKQDKILDMVPVTDKKPAADAATERATLDSITWDAPSLLQVASKDTIIWDKSEKAESFQVAAQKSEPVAPKSADHVVRDIPQNAYQMAAVMPDAKSLNDLEPGNPASPMPVAAEAANVPHSMMQALAKYQSMQRMGGENAVAAKDFDATPSQRKFAKLDNAVRRY